MVPGGVHHHRLRSIDSVRIDPVRVAVFVMPSSTAPGPSAALSSPSTVVLGTPSLPAAVAYWGALGFEAGAVRSLPSASSAELFGVDSDLATVTVTVPGSTTGHVMLVETPTAPSVRGPWDSGPYAIDLYTTDTDRSIEVALGAGARMGGRLEYRFGDSPLEEASVFFPDGTMIVFINIAHRRPSILDREPSRLHSEVHSIVSTVRSADTANGFWSGLGQMTVMADAVLDGGLDELMGLPHPVSARMTILCSAATEPLRYEFLELRGLLEGDVIGDVSTWPLPPGRPLACFDVSDLAAVQERLATSGASFGSPRALGDGTSLCSGVDPNGIRFYLRSPA
jgi:hypothetical protein